MGIGERLKQIRASLGLTQKELGSKIEAEPSAIGNWEREYSAIPVARIAQICHEFGIRREWFEHGEGEMIVEPSNSKETIEDAQRDLFRRLLAGLTESEREIFIELMREQTSSVRTQTNNGTVNGDMVQN